MCKKSGFLFFSFLVLALVGNAFGELLLHYGFDETSGTIATDSTGGNDGVVSGGTWATPGAIPQTNPGHLSLNVGSVDASNLSSLVGDFTLMTWLNKSRSPRFPWLVGTTGGGVNLQICIEEDAMPGQVEVGCGGGWEIAMTGFSSDSWVHLAFVREAASGAVNMYLDGNLEHTFSCGAGNINLSTLMIGKSPAWSERYLNGGYDDFALWNEALPAGNIDGSEPGTINYYRANGVFLQPRVQFEAPISGALENVTPATLTVKLLNSEEGQTYTVDYAATGGTAGSGEDYILTPGTLVFNPGESSGTISIEIIDDDIDEGGETIIVTLSNPTGGSLELGTITQHTYTIVERTKVSFEAASSSGSEADTPALVPVNLLYPASETVAVDYAVTGGTATGGGVDYTLANGTLSFSPGETTKAISVALVDDDIKERDETIVITLSNPTNATLGPNTRHTFTIIDSKPGVLWDGLVWYYNRAGGGPFINEQGQLEWDPEEEGQYVTRIPTQDFSKVGDKVKMTYWWLTDGDHHCPPGSCYQCPDRCTGDITCIAGTSDFRVGLFEADGEYIEKDGYDLKSDIFVGYKGYNFRFGPNMQATPTRWVDCDGETHKTGNFAKKPVDLTNLMHTNAGLMDYIPGFELPPGEWSLFTVSIERTSSSSVRMSITLNGRTYTDTDGSASGQPQKIDVFGIHMRNGRNYTRLVLDNLCDLGPADFNGDDIIDAKDLGVLTNDWLKQGRYVPGGTPPDANGLKVHYALDETSGSVATDSTGGNDGTIIGGTWATPGAIPQTNPGHLVLSGGHIDVPGLPAAVGDFTIASWLKKTGGTRFPWLVGTAGGGANLQISVEEDGNPGQVEVGCGGGWEVAMTGFSSGSWVHLAFVREAASGNVRMYLDGSLEHTFSCGAGNINLSTLMIGKSPEYADRYLNGGYDDFRLYDYALPDEEALYLASHGGQILIPPDSPANLYEDDIIDFKDFARFASQWLDLCE